jgi:DNA-binding MarR family transcriptional regulator
MLTPIININIVAYTQGAYAHIRTKIMTRKNTTVGVKECQEFGKTCVVYNLRRASRAVTQLYEEHLKPSGLLPTQFTLLAAVRVMGPVQMSKIAKELVLDRTTLTRNLRPLEREGLLSVVYAKSDQRLREISITNKGMKKLKQAIPYWEEAQNLATKMLSTNRLDRMLGDLRATVNATTKVI